MGASCTLATLATLALIGAQVLAAAPAYAQRSAADIETARQLYNQGIELRDKGDLRGALEKLRAAHALGNTPITGVELCKAHAALAQPVEAREACLGVGRIPPLAGETSRSQDARNEAARIAEDVKTKIAVVRVHITGVPKGREPTVLVDGAPVPLAALGEARAINPGRHELVANVGRGPETHAVIELSPGETKEVTLLVQAPPQDEAPVAGPVNPGGEPPPPRARTNGLAMAGFVVGGIGAGVGAITGIIALSDKSDLDGRCTDKICGRADHDALDRAKAMGNVSTAAFIVGGVGVGVGLYALLTAPRATTGQASPARGLARGQVTLTPDFGPGGVGVHGSF